MVLFTIKVKYSSSPDDVYYTSPQLQFNVNCTDDQIVIHSPANMSYSYSFSQYNTSHVDRTSYYWGTYYCSEDKCCGDMFHFVAGDSSNVTVPTNFELVEIWKNHVTIDESVTGTFDMYLFTSDMINVLPIYEKITLTVLHECANDAFMIATSSLSTNSNVTITEGKAYVQPDPNNATFN
mmetsp:Transcript_9283/g.14060  ORF Transcript_9283/g.14060 Transcript_9283/m.14060 type:complete len:180 (-) Transcript_9283:370-909(-)